MNSDNLKSGDLIINNRGDLKEFVGYGKQMELRDGSSHTIPIVTLRDSISNELETCHQIQFDLFYNFYQDVKGPDVDPVIRASEIFKNSLDSSQLQEFCKKWMRSGENHNKLKQSLHHLVLNYEQMYSAHCSFHPKTRELMASFGIYLLLASELIGIKREITLKKNEDKKGKEDA